MKRIFTTILLFFVSISFAKAETENSNQQDQVIQSQKQFERANEQELELKQLEKDRLEFEGKKREETEESFLENDGKIVQDFSAIQCFRINKINFSPNKILSKIVENKITKEYLNRCLAISQVVELAQDITNHFVEQGFVTSRAEIPVQNLKEGILQINIVESYLEKIVLNQDGFFDKTQKILLFGLVDDKEVLNLKKIDRGVEQMNRLASNRAVAKILPGSAVNKSIVAVENNSAKKTRVNLAFDTNGNDISGRYRDTIGLSQDNLLHLNETFNINKTGNHLDSARTTNRSDSFNTNFSLPFANNILTLNYSKSSYYFVAGENNFSVSEGHTSTKSISLNSGIFKGKKFKINSNFDITNRYNQNFANKQKIETSSRKASFGNFSLINSIFFDNSSLYLKPTYSKSLNIFDAQKDDKNLPASAAHAEFEIFKLYANYSHKPTNSYLEGAFYNLTFDSQIANHKLYGIDQFSVGGVYTVRGFRNGSIANDSGYSLRNELTFNLGKILLPNLKSENLKQKVFSQINYFSITPFYDYGAVKSAFDNQGGRVSSSGLSVGFDNGTINSSLTFAWVLSKSQYLLTNYQENRAIYFDIGMKFGFF